MNNMLLIDNVLYALHETAASTFILKSEMTEALSKGELVTLPPSKKCIKFNDKFYAYIQVKQKE